MSKTERVLGCAYIPVHTAILPLLLGLVLAVFGAETSSPNQSLIYFIISFILILIIMFKFLKKSFSDMVDEFWRAVQAIILGYVMYRALFWAAVLLLERVMMAENPNSDAIITDIQDNFRVMIVVASVLAPIVEETLFRGALFGTIRQKNRIAAYIVSVLLFSVFHIWGYLVIDFKWETLILVVQYIPPSIALAWCYERGGTIWAPIILHSGINLLASMQVRG